MRPDSCTHHLRTHRSLSWLEQPIYIHEYKPLSSIKTYVYLKEFDNSTTAKVALKFTRDIHSQRKVTFIIMTFFSSLVYNSFVNV